MEKEPSKMRKVRKDAELEAWRRARKPSAVQLILTLFMAVSISAFVLGFLPIIPPPLREIREFLFVAGGFGSFVSMLLLGLYKGGLVFLKEAALGILIFISGPIWVMLSFLASQGPYHNISEFFIIFIILGILFIPFGIYIMATGMSRTEETVTRGEEERIKFPKWATVGIAVYLIGLSLTMGALVNSDLHESATGSELIVFGFILMPAGLFILYRFQFGGKRDVGGAYDAEKERYKKFHEQLRRERLK